MTNKSLLMLAATAGLTANGSPATAWTSTSTCRFVHGLVSANAGKVSLFRGPLLLAWESTSSAIATGNDEGKRPAAAAPELDLKALKTQLVESDRNAPAALVLIDTTDAVGRPIRIRDFGTAGQNRIPYATWFPARGEPPMAFTRANPLRTFRIIGPHR